MILGKACDLIEEHQGKQEEKKRTSTGKDPGVAKARDPGLASPSHKAGPLGIRPEVALGYRGALLLQSQPVPLNLCFILFWIPCLLFQIQIKLKFFS